MRKIHYNLSVVINAWSELSQREQDILIKRYGMKQTEQEVGRKYNLTRERIRQIEDGALARLNKSLEESVVIPIQPKQ